MRRAMQAVGSLSKDAQPSRDEILRGGAQKVPKVALAFLLLVALVCLSGTEIAHAHAESRESDTDCSNAIIAATQS
jgi:hypothetical protein